MPGGVSYLVGTVTVNGAVRYDVTEWSFTFGGNVLYNRADGRKYPQQGATVEHTASLQFTGYDLTNAAQSGSASPLVGTVYNNGATLSIAKNVSGNPILLTLSPCIVTAAEVRGGHNALSTVNMTLEAVGSNGNEPTVSFAVAS